MAIRISSRNARFQQLQTLLTNRNKRHRAAEFLVQGVRPLSMAIQYGWEVRTLLYDAERHLSNWAKGLLAAHPHVEHVKMAPHLLAELAEKDESELIAVMAMRPDALDRIETGPDFLGVVFDRPTQPGNIGAVIRSADAFGAQGVITTGHAADAYDPKSVRASTGSFFSTPVVRTSSSADVMQWVSELRKNGLPLVVVATDESADTDVSSCDLKQPVLLLIGSETTGLTQAWRDAADVTVRIPMTGSASSLNAANAATVLLYETQRQRLSH